MSAANILVATRDDVLLVEPEGGRVSKAEGFDMHHPTCVATDSRHPGRAWCGTARDGLFRSDDGGASWAPSGLDGVHVTSIAGSPAGADLVWCGTEPSAIWRSSDGGASWSATRDLEELPSSREWSFPPKPHTHHVRWIACHPTDPDRIWAAIEAGALVRTDDGGRSWHDRVRGGPRDTHELEIHPRRAETLRAAAGDGYFESHDGGRRWDRPEAGLDAGYMRSVAVDPGKPEVVLVSSSSQARSAYVAGHADGRVHRREGDAPWSRVLGPWPNPPSTIAPLLAAGAGDGELWAADERGVFRTGDSGHTWEAVARFDPIPTNLRGLALLPTG